MGKRLSIVGWSHLFFAVARMLVLAIVAWASFGSALTALAAAPAPRPAAAARDALHVKAVRLLDEVVGLQKACQDQDAIRLAKALTAEPEVL